MAADKKDQNKEKEAWNGPSSKTPKTIMQLEFAVVNKYSIYHLEISTGTGRLFATAHNSVAVLPSLGTTRALAPTVRYTSRSSHRSEG